MKILYKYPIIFVIILYLIANFFMLFNNGYFWDDWCFSSVEGIKDICSGVGVPFMIPIHIFILKASSSPALVYHILTAIFEIIDIVIFFKVLSFFKISDSYSFLIALIFALLPYNLAKTTIACFMYTLGFLFFLLAVISFLYYEKNHRIVLRVVSILCFFISYSLLPSTLVLSLTFITFFVVYNDSIVLNLKISSLKKILSGLRKWIDFMILPFAFWVFRFLFLKPTGAYTSGYREFSLNSIIQTPLEIVNTFVQNFAGLGISISPLGISKFYSILFVVFFIIFYLYIRKFDIKPFLNSKWFLYTGIIFFISGSFAYNMVGLQPFIEGYNSRHEILLRIGASLIIIYLLSLLNSISAQKIILSFLVASFIIFTLNIQLQFQKSWFKQLCLENEFAKKDFFNEGVNAVIIDNTREYNEFNRIYSIHNYTGILYKTFGTQNRFAIDSKDLPGMVSSIQNLVNYSFYHMKDCKNLSNFNYYYFIDQGNIQLSEKMNVSMLLDFYFNKKSFNDNLKNLLLIKRMPYNN